MAEPEDDPLAAQVLADLAATWWREPGPPPPEFVAMLAGTFAYQCMLLHRRMLALWAAMREAARWN